MAEKEKAVVPEIIDSVEALEAKMKAMREAQKIFAAFTPRNRWTRSSLRRLWRPTSSVSRLPKWLWKKHSAASWKTRSSRITTRQSTFTMRTKIQRPAAVIEEDPAYGIKKVAEPIGLIAAVIPTTNPTSTAIFKTLICLKTRNAIIISPHPAAKKCNDRGCQGRTGRSGESWRSGRESSDGSTLLPLS